MEELPSPPCNPLLPSVPASAGQSRQPPRLCQQRGSQLCRGSRGCVSVAVIPSCALDEPFSLPPALLLPSSIALCVLALLQARYRTSESRDGLDPKAASSSPRAMGRDRGQSSLPPPRGEDVQRSGHGDPRRSPRCQCALQSTLHGNKSTRSVTRKSLS